MSTICCPYCHKHIASADYPAHEAKHRAPRSDGQQSEYATLPLEKRHDGPLAGVPTIYEHQSCGVATRMPEEIVRSYLKNPYLYSADATFCCGCQKHVPFGECTWVDTGEDLQTYMDKLREANPQRKPEGG